MKVILLAGGLGTRLAELTETIPKPMVSIGGKPILWHIMKTFAHYGHREFVIALGYKGYVIKDFFLSYRYHTSSLTVQTRHGEVTLHPDARQVEDWTIHLLETGMSTGTNGRVCQALTFAGNEPCMMTYGDGVADVDLRRLLEFHRSHGRLATVTAVRPPARFGGLTIEASGVPELIEKPQLGEGWINGGFFVLEPGVRDYVQGDEESFEREPISRLAHDRQLMAYEHHGFWQCMDTLRDQRLLESLWSQGNARWKVWP